MKTLYLFPDTNVFLQCKPLDQLAWADLGNWDRFEIILTRPVQTEIDNLKGKGNSRQASRARKASSLIRELLQAEGEKLTLRDRPLVLLCLRHDLRRDESAAEILNYDERDDQLVGTALGFCRASPGADVWLLTNDTGPMASAKAVGLKFQDIPESWLLPPEADESEKQVSVLKAEIARYKSLEPSFVIKAGEENEHRLIAELTAYTSLAENEVDGLMRRLTSKYQLCSDFGPKERQERMPSQTAGRTILAAALGHMKEEFHPATQDEINKYQEAYEKWEKECREMLTNLADLLHQRLTFPQFQISIENIGARPAEDALVVLHVEGDIWLLEQKVKDQDSETNDDPDSELMLPRPPAPPKGRWKAAGPWGAISDMARMLQAYPAIDTIRSPVLSRPPSRDANALYFKEGRRGIPLKHIEYECAQWRHAQAAANREYDVLCPLKAGTYSALIKVEVHAANLAKPESIQHYVNVSVNEFSCLTQAQEMVAALVAY